jgi:hypothetical protein
MKYKGTTEIIYTIEILSKYFLKVTHTHTHTHTHTQNLPVDSTTVTAM